MRLLFHTEVNYNILASICVMPGHESLFCSHLLQEEGSLMMAEYSTGL